MRNNHGPIRRVMRGETFRPGRYWTRFFIYSFIVHCCALAILSGVGESFLRSLPRPSPENPPLLYVGLVFNAPIKVGAPAINFPIAAPPVKHIQKQPAAKVVSSVKPALKNGGDMHKRSEAKPVELAAEAKTAKPVSEPAIPYHPSLPPVPRHEEPAVGPSRVADNVGIKKASKPDVKQGATITVPPPSPHSITDKTGSSPARIDTEAADRKYVEFFEPQEGTITVIKGDELETLQVAKLPAPATTAERTPPVSPVRVEEKTPEPVYGSYSSATVNKTADANIYVRDIPVEGPATEPIADTQLSQTSTPLSKIVKLAEQTPPPLLDISDVTGRPDSNIGQAASTDLFGLLLEMFSGYTPSMTRPAPLFNASLTTPGPPAPADIPPGMVVERIETPLVPPVVNATRTAMPEEPAPIQAPKIIEVEDYSDETAEPPSIAFTSPGEGNTDRSLMEVEGKVTGTGINSVIFTMGGIKKELLVTEGKFTTTVALDEGRNVLNAAALDEFGRAARARVVVNYSPAHSVPIISFVSPKDGGIIDALYKKDMAITGTVSGDVSGPVRVYLNKTIEDVPVVNGKFILTELIESEKNTLYAEATLADGTTSRSDEIHFRVINLFPKDLTVLMETGGSGGVVMTHSWRPHPLSNDQARDAKGPEFDVSETEDGTVTEVESAGSGIFTVGASYDIPAGDTVKAVFHVTLYGYDPDLKTTRSFGPFLLKGRGRLKAVRVLLPERVFWEDDDWFSGIIESGSGTTKFKQPEGITWTEED
jgi:hypothetical protein